MYITLLNKYGGFQNLKKVLHAFRQNVISSQEIKHFMYNLSLEKIYFDQVNYLNYVFLKSDQEYIEKIQQTSNEEFKIPEWQFEKVVEILQKTLINDFSILEKDSIKFSFHILELLEESRSQTSETHSNIWKPADVTFKNLKNFFDANGCSAKIDYEENEVKILEGLGCPISIKIRHKDKLLVLHSIFNFQSELILAEDKEVAELLSLKFNGLKFEAVQVGKNSKIFSHYAIPFHDNIPTRLLIRVINSFIDSFSEAQYFYKKHSAKSLDNFKKLRKFKNETLINKDTKSGIYKESPNELINDLNKNTVDEMLVIALFESHYKVELQIQHGEVNRYICKTKDRTYSYEFHQLKELIIKKMEEI